MSHCELRQLSRRIRGGMEWANYEMEKGSWSSPDVFPGSFERNDALFTYFFALITKIITMVVTIANTVVGNELVIFPTTPVEGMVRVGQGEGKGNRMGSFKLSNQSTVNLRIWGSRPHVSIYEDGDNPKNLLIRCVYWFQFVEKEIV